MSDWQEDARCAEPGMSEVFFPEGIGGGRGLYGPARKVCSQCPVTVECLEFVMAFEQQGHRQGFWGGLSPKERDRLRTNVRQYGSKVA